MCGEPLFNIIKAGDIIFSFPNNWFFKFVRYWTRDKWTHVALVTQICKNEVYIIEALPKGIDVNTLSKYEKEKRDFIVYRLNNLTDELRNKLVFHSYSFINSKYDFAALANFLIGKAIFGKKKRYFCSELIYRILVHLKIIKNSENAEIVSPHDLRLLIENLSTVVYKKEYKNA